MWPPEGFCLTFYLFYDERGLNYIWGVLNVTFSFAVGLQGEAWQQQTTGWCSYENLNPMKGN